MNYFEYFSEIEQRFSHRRGSILLLSTLDWALIETWREAGIPLEAVLRGIDDAFDKYDARSQRSKGRLRKVNGLAWCAQAVMQATEEMAEAATGVQKAEAREPAASGFETERVAAHLEHNAAALETSATKRRCHSMNLIAPSPCWKSASSARYTAPPAKKSSPPCARRQTLSLRHIAAACLPCN